MQVLKTGGWKNRESVMMSGSIHGSIIIKKSIRTVYNPTKKHAMVIAMLKELASNKYELTVVISNGVFSTGNTDTLNLGILDMDLRCAKRIANQYLKHWIKREKEKAN